MDEYYTVEIVDGLPVERLISTKEKDKIEWNYEKLNYTRDVPEEEF